MLILSCSPRQEILLRGTVRSAGKVSAGRSLPEGTAGISYRKHYRLKRKLLASKNRENEKLNRKAIELLMEGELREAEILLRTIIKYSPGDSVVLNNMAILRELQGRDDRAFINYDEALKISPENRDILGNFIRFKYKPENLKLSPEPQWNSR